MGNELIYQMALAAIPQVGPVHAKLLLQHFDPAEIFHAKKHELERIEGVGPARAAAITRFNRFDMIEKEIEFLSKYQIHPLFITDPAFPQRLLNCYDAPILLYYKGSADLNVSRIVSIIGTRSNTEYGKKITEKIVADLAEANVTVVSGLAFGIDAIAHKASLKNKLPTIGVLGHGLDQVYPAEHTGLAREIIAEGGGLLTEFRTQTKPDRHHFPSRNRIVAGMTDATVVIETGLKGGSMITAELADSYHRDVFAVPGRLTDGKSAGCLELIRKNKAMVLTNANALLDTMGWGKKTIGGPGNQKELFPELSANEKLIVDMLDKAGEMEIDDMRFRAGLSSSAMAAAVLNLEINSVLLSLPGKRYRLS